MNYYVVLVYQPDWINRTGPSTYFLGAENEEEAKEKAADALKGENYIGRGSKKKHIYRDLGRLEFEVESLRDFGK